MSPTQLTLRHFRDLGYEADVTERWIPKAKVRKDLFGIIDVLIVGNDEPGVIGVQTTTDSHMADRIKKAQESDILPVFLRCGNRFVVQGWKKRDGKWQAREWWYT